MHQKISKGPAYGPASLKTMNSDLNIVSVNIACSTVLDIATDDIAHFYYSARKHFTPKLLCGDLNVTRSSAH